MFLLILAIVGLSYGLTLEEAMRLASEMSPRVRALEERVGVFAGRERAARSFPNPELRVEVGGGEFLYLLELSQPLPLWGVREKRYRVVVGEREAFESTVEARKREFLALIYSAFFSALSRRELLKVEEENWRIAKEVEDFVRRSFKLGEATRLELLRAERESRLARMRFLVARADYEAALKELSGLLGTEVEEVEGKLLPPPLADAYEVEKSPRVVALQKSLKAIERRIELEKALAKPSLGAGMVVEESGEGYYELRAALVLGVPLFYRREGEILESVALRESLREELKGELIALKRGIEAVALQLKVIKRELEILDSSLLPRAEEELKLAIRSYRLRVISLMELSDVRRRYYEMLAERIALLERAHALYSRFIEIGGWR